METNNFFQSIGHMQLKGNLSITIGMQDDQKAVVSILFTPEGAATDPGIIPLILKGTFRELDDAFLKTVQTPIQQSGELQTNFAEHEKALNQVKSKLEAKKSKIKSPVIEASTQNQEQQEESEDSLVPQQSAEQKRKNYEQVMKRIEELNGAMKYAQALEILPSVADYPEKQAELEIKAQNLRRKDQQLKAQQSLF